MSSSAPTNMTPRRRVVTRLGTVVSGAVVAMNLMLLSCVAARACAHARAYFLWRHSAHRPTFGQSLPGSSCGPAGPVFSATTDLRLPHAAQVHAREDPEHRDHGPHRRGQDHDDRAHPLLHRPHPQDG